MSFVFAGESRGVDINTLKSNGCKAVIDWEDQEELVSFTQLKHAYSEDFSLLIHRHKKAKEMVFTAMQVGFQQIVLAENDLSIQELTEIKMAAKKNHCQVVGPNSGGIYHKGTFISTLPIDLFSTGSIALFSRSTSLALAVNELLKQEGLGLFSFYDFGSSEMALAKFSDFLPKIEKEDEVTHIIILGTCGGYFEQMAAKMIQRAPKKKLYFTLFGHTLKPYRARAEIMHEFEGLTFADKKKSLMAVGGIPCEHIFDIPKKIQEGR